MSNTNKTTPSTEKELVTLLDDAVARGDHLEVDRLMAVTVDEPGKDEGNVQDNSSVEQDGNSDQVQADVTQTGSTDEDGSNKEEAAITDSQGEAASTPEAKTPKDETEQLRQELHRLKSDAGRIPFLQSRMKELERELREAKLSRKVTGDTSSDGKSSNQKVVDVPDNLKGKIAELREVDPSLADLLEDMARSLRTETHETANRVVSSWTETERELEEQRVIQEESQKLTAEVPWAPEAFRSQEWQNWKETLTPGRRALAESMYADEVKIALSAFVADMQARQGSVNNAAQVTSTQSVVDESSEKIKQDRARKLGAGAAAPAPASKGAKQVLSEDALFQEYYEQIQKENHLT